MFDPMMDAAVYKAVATKAEPCFSLPTCSIDMWASLDVAANV